MSLLGIVTETAEINIIFPYYVVAKFRDLDLQIMNPIYDIIVMFTSVDNYTSRAYVDTNIHFSNAEDSFPSSAEEPTVEENLTFQVPSRWKIGR